MYKYIMTDYTVGYGRYIFIDAAQTITILYNIITKRLSKCVIVERGEFTSFVTMISNGLGNLRLSGGSHISCPYLLLEIQCFSKDNYIDGRYIFLIMRSTLLDGRCFFYRDAVISVLQALLKLRPICKCGFFRDFLDRYGTL